MAHYLFFGAVYDSATDPVVSKMYSKYNQDTYRWFGVHAIDAAYDLKGYIKSYLGIYW